MLVLITFIQHYVVGSCQCSKIRKEMKDTRVGRGENLVHAGKTILYV